MCIVGSKSRENQRLESVILNDYNFSFPKNFHFRFSDLPARYFVYTQQIVNASSVIAVRKVINGRPVPSLSAQPASDGPKEKGIIRLTERLGARLNKVQKTLRPNTTLLVFLLTLHNGGGPTCLLYTSPSPRDRG